MAFELFKKREEKAEVSRRDFLAGSAAILAAPALIKTEAAASTPLVHTETVAASEFVSEDEVQAVLREVLDGMEYCVTRKLEDGNGLHLFEAEITQNGCRTEYLFKRGRPEKEEKPGLRIDVAYYDEEDVPRSGHQVAVHTDGAWKITR